jgi:hypothetical protein
MSADLTTLDPGQTAATYINRKWGARTRLVPLSTIAVLTTPTRALKNNPRRMQSLIVNVGTGSIFAGFDNGLTTANGILISPLGGSMSLVIDEDAELTTYDLYLVSAAVGNNASVWEIETL